MKTSHGNALAPQIMQCCSETSEPRRLGLGQLAQDLRLRAD